jgi:hypothetical protein
MANEAAIASLADSLASRLGNAWTEALAERHGTVAFQSVASGGLLADVAAEGANSVVTVWPWRLTINEQLRNVAPAQVQRTAGQANRPLMLDAHLLLAVWSPNAARELAVFTWVLRELHRVPVLDASTLSAAGGWAADEVVQLVPAEMSVEDMMRLWDAITPSYRLSASYVARIVQVDVEEADAPPVVARRFDYGGVAR